MSEPTAGVGDVLGDAGACPQIECGGKTWTFGKPTQRAKDALDELVVAQATTEILALKKSLPADDYAEMKQDLRNAIGAREYKTWGAGWLKVMGEPDGNILFLLSLLRERHPEATIADAKRLIAEKSDEVELAVVRVTPPFLSLLAQYLPDSIPPEKKVEMAGLLQSEFLSRLVPSTPTATP